MNIRVLFDEIDKDLAKLGKISRFYSDDDNITITTDYKTYKVNRSMLDGIMGDYGYEFYDFGDNGDKVMLTYNKVSDSRKVSDELEKNPYKRTTYVVYVLNRVARIFEYEDDAIDFAKRLFSKTKKDVEVVRFIEKGEGLDRTYEDEIIWSSYNQVPDSRKVKDGMDNDIIEKFKNKVMRKVKYSNSDDVLYDLQDRAMSLYDGDIEEAIERAIDDGLIYNEDILALAERYGVVDYSQLITDFYDDLYNDLREYLEDNIDGEEE